jgi:hypothetical protein
MTFRLLIKGGIVDAMAALGRHNIGKSTFVSSDGYETLFDVESHLSYRASVQELNNWFTEQMLTPFPRGTLLLWTEKEQ